MMEKKPVLIVILGPTGVGKTSISLKLAELLDCPIISSDSRQFYNELKIGTAAPTEEELERVKHYFIGSHSIHDEYNAGQYEQDVMQLTAKIFTQRNAALLVGGSMMYIDAVCNGMDDIPSVPVDVRDGWLKVFEENGLEYIQRQLQELDPSHYQQVDLKNPKRILHALEICSVTGKPYSALRTGVKKERPFQIIKIGLNRPRAELYERINQRVDVMMADGLLEEAKQYFEYRHLNTLNTVGYKEIYEYMLGNWTLEHAVEMIKQDSRRYAKRQLTWFNRDSEIHWFHPDDEDQIIDFVNKKLS
jgi:tRNA dimethylallyltransferase